MTDDKQLYRKFGRHERLRSRKAIDELFRTGIILRLFPFKVIFTVEARGQSPVRLALSVPKKIHRRAVDRNLVKRRIREAYRLNREPLHMFPGFERATLNLMLVYVSSNILDYADIEKKLQRAIAATVKHLEESDDVRPSAAD
jgi:ribonuclease P protein component